MKLPKDQPFWTSVILHVVVLLALGLATIIQAFKPKPKEHVFEMVSLPPEVPVAAQTTAPDIPPPPDLPDIEEMPDIPDIPDVPPPPAPTPPPKPTPSPTPAPPKPQDTIMSADDFFKQHGKPQPRQPTTQARPSKPVTVPKISAPRLHVPQNLPRSEQLTQAQMTALQRYTSQLNQRLNSVWQRPDNLAGIRLSVTVIFDVSSSGVISNIRLRPSSGNGAFDQSVRDAFNRVASAGPTPTGQQHTFSLDFKMVD